MYTVMDACEYVYRVNALYPLSSNNDIRQLLLYDLHAYVLMYYIYLIFLFHSRFYLRIALIYFWINSPIDGNVKSFILGLYTCYIHTLMKLLQIIPFGCCLYA